MPARHLDVSRNTGIHTALLHGLCCYTVRSTPPRRMTLLEKLDRIPPYAFRLLAKVRISHGRSRPMTAHEISVRSSGMSRSMIAKLSVATSWKGFMDQYDPFVIGCGFDPVKPWRALAMLKRICSSRNKLTKVRHLRLDDKSIPLTEHFIRAEQLRRIHKIMKL